MQDTSTQPQRRTIALRPIDWMTAGSMGLLLFVGAGALFSLHIINPEWGAFQGDLRAHLTWAKDIDAGERRMSTRPLFPLLIIIGSRFPGVGYAVAAAGILAFSVVAAYLVTLIILHHYARGRWTVARVALLAFALSVASAIYAPMVNEYIYSRVGTPNVWHNPTQVVLAPLALAAFFSAERWLSNGGKKSAGLAAGLLAATVLVKPNFALAFIPALGIYLLLAARRKVKGAIPIVVPTMLILALQYFFVFGDVGGEASAGISLGLISDALWRFPYAVLALGFPLVALTAMPKPWRQHRGLMLAWLMVVIAFAQRMFLVETGPRVDHGNWHWGYFMALKIVLTYSAVPLLNARGDALSPLSAAWAVLLIHMWSGVIYMHRLFTGMGFRG